VDGHEVQFPGLRQVLFRQLVPVDLQAPVAVTRHTAKKDDLLAAGAPAVIATDHMDVAEAVHRYTGGTGADIVLDLVMGPGQQDLLKAARPEGTLVAAGVLDPRPTPFPASAPLTIFRYRSFEHTLDPVVVKRMAAFLNAGQSVT
jgi:NADPH:quinone reductase-like Zn-dependent oxidoreductase